MPNMKLPKKGQLSITEAAKELGCPEADVRYYLYDGQLRFAISRRGNEHRGIIPVSDVPQEQAQSILNHIPIETMKYKCPDLERNVDSSKVLDMPNYLYLKPETNLQLLCFDDLDEQEDQDEELYTYNFETLTGDSVFLLSKLPTRDNRHMLQGISVGKLMNYDDGVQLLEPAIIAREDFDKFLSAHDMGQPLERNNDASKQKTTTLKGDAPFKLPERQDPAAEAMVHYGNAFFRQYKRVPAFTELMNYTLEQDNDNFGVDVKPGTGIYIIEEKEYTRKNLARRFKRYKGNN